MDQKDKELLDKFASSKSAKQFSIAYGGDGTLLKVAANVGDKKGIIPVRDYARCKAHEDILECICNENDSSVLKHRLKYSKHNYLNAYVNGLYILCKKKEPKNTIVTTDSLEETN